MRLSKSHWNPFISFSTLNELKILTRIFSHFYNTQELVLIHIRASDLRVCKVSEKKYREKKCCSNRKKIECGIDRRANKRRSWRKKTALSLRKNNDDERVSKRERYVISKQTVGQFWPAYIMQATWENRKNSIWKKMNFFTLLVVFFWCARDGTKLREEWLWVWVHKSIHIFSIVNVNIRASEREREKQQGTKSLN